MGSYAGARRLVMLFAGICGCAGAAATSQVASDVARGDYRAAVARYERESHSPAVLRALSESVLLRAARSRDPDERRAAFIELSMLGTRAEPLLIRLSREREATPVRAQALRLRTTLGDADAREALRALVADPDPYVVDSALAALEPGRDDARLLCALRSARGARRATALALFARAPLRYRQPLIDVSRFDPDPQLRAAALHALARYGASAAEAFEAATRDADGQVRAAALSGLAEVAPEQATALLDRQLGAAVSPESIAAASALLRLQPAREPARAYAALEAALRSTDPTLRARAASALRLLPPTRLDRQVLSERLRVEPAHSIRLTLALALGVDDPAARRALCELSKSSTLTGAEAAAELSPHSDQARARLRAFSTHAAALVRMTAARLMGRALHDPKPIAKLLADASWRVRDAAAGAVLNVM